MSIKIEMKGNGKTYLSKLIIETKQRVNEDDNEEDDEDEKEIIAQIKRECRRIDRECRRIERPLSLFTKNSLVRDVINLCVKLNRADLVDWLHRNRERIVNNIDDRIKDFELY